MAFWRQEGGGGRGKGVFSFQFQVVSRGGGRVKTEIGKSEMIRVWRFEGRPPSLGYRTGLYV